MAGKKNEKGAAKQPRRSARHAAAAQTPAREVVGGNVPGSQEPATSGVSDREVTIVDPVSGSQTQSRITTGAEPGSTSQGTGSVPVSVHQAAQATTVSTDNPPSGGRAAESAETNIETVPAAENTGSAVQEVQTTPLPAGSRARAGGNTTVTRHGASGVTSSDATSAAIPARPAVSTVPATGDRSSRPVERVEASTQSNVSGATAARGRDAGAPLGSSQVPVSVTSTPPYSIDAPSAQLLNPPDTQAHVVETQVDTNVGYGERDAEAYQPMETELVRSLEVVDFEESEVEGSVGPDRDGNRIPRVNEGIRTGRGASRGSARASMNLTTLARDNGSDRWYDAVVNAIDRANISTHHRSTERQPLSIRERRHFENMTENWLSLNPEQQAIEYAAEVAINARASRNERLARHALLKQKTGGREPYTLDPVPKVCLSTDDPQHRGILDGMDMSIFDKWPVMSDTMEKAYPIIKMNYINSQDSAEFMSIMSNSMYKLSEKFKDLARTSDVLFAENKTLRALVMKLSSSPPGNTSSSRPRYPKPQLLTAETMSIETINQFLHVSEAAEKMDPMFKPELCVDRNLLNDLCPTGEFTQILMVLRERRDRLLAETTDIPMSALEKLKWPNSGSSLQNFTKFFQSIRKIIKEQYVLRIDNHEKANLFEMIVKKCPKEMQMTREIIANKISANVNPLGEKAQYGPDYMPTSVNALAVGSEPMETKSQRRRKRKQLAMQRQAQKYGHYSRDCPMLVNSPRNKASLLKPKRRRKREILSDDSSEVQFISTNKPPKVRTFIAKSVSPKPCEGMQVFNHEYKDIKDAMMDSGADAVVASYSKHGSFCRDVKDAEGQVTSANGTISLVVKVARVGLNVFKNGKLRRKVHGQRKHKNVLLVKGGLPEELDRVIQMLSLLQGGSVNVFPKIKVRKDGKPLRRERKTMVGVSQLITDEQHSLINNLQRDALAGDSKWLSCYHEHVVVGDSFAHYLAEVRQAVEAQRMGLTKVVVPGMLWVRNTATSVDLVERINTGDTSGIDFGKVIRLKRHVEDIADDDLGDILLPDVDEEVDPVSEEIEIGEAISSMISKATDASMEMKKKLKALCLEYWDVFATDHSQTRISKLEPMPVFPLENYEFKYPRARPTSAEKSRFIKEKIMSMEKRKLLKLVPAVEFGSVVFAVPKKGNKLRMVVDLVDVNKVLRRDVNQLPFLEKSFENLAQSKFYASFDVVSGFDQLGITEEAKKYFNIVSEHGTYQLNFAPMGYHSTPRVLSPADGEARGGQRSRG
eukprot:augustus_masked-scaffold_8-processed-gene-9.1-mRNA-1 protein AED:1.00 eAED:1.00 QI:0/0/0/0/1/1/4/0/1269